MYRASRELTRPVLRDKHSLVPQSSYASLCSMLRAHAADSNALQNWYVIHDALKNRIMLAQLRPGANS